MISSLATIASVLPSSDAVKVVGLLCGTFLIAIGITSFAGYELNVSSGSVTYRKAC